LFIGNLDPEVDEKLLYDTFSAFGIILQVPKVTIYNLNAFKINLMELNKLI
jgi:RNA recognition motif-containing protein